MSFTSFSSYSQQWQSSTNEEGPFVVEYSRSQRQFHVDSLADSLETNLHCFKEATNGDWEPLGIFPTFGEAWDFYDKLQERLTRKPKTRKTEAIRAKNRSHNGTR